MSDETPGAVHLADEFGRVAKTLQRRLDHAAPSQVATSARGRVLLEVHRNGPVPVSQVAVRVGIAQGTASALVEALRRDRLVARETDPRDRRSTLVRTTETGADLARLWQVRYEQTAEHTFGALSEQRRRDLLALLQDLAPDDRSARTIS